jgi:ligand-binding SRPBCC domain-containing protein
MSFRYDTQAVDRIKETIAIRAPIERCFALSTRVELVQRTLGMTPVAGVIAGHVNEGSRVTWSGWKFGLPTRHHTLITAFERPHANSSTTKAAFFQDTQEQGRFAFFQHDHFFTEKYEGERITMLRDEVRFALPFGPLGRFAAKYLLAPHIRKLARQRFAMIKDMAEGEGWREWVEDSAPAPAR